MAEFKYTDQEIDDLIEWFNGRELPKSIQLDKATFIPDTQATVKSLIVIAKEKRNSIFMPMIDRLFSIKEYIIGNNDSNNG